MQSKAYSGKKKIGGMNNEHSHEAAYLFAARQYTTQDSGSSAALQLASGDVPAATVHPSKLHVLS